jgi:hypothetical protein
VLAGAIVDIWHCDRLLDLGDLIGRALRGLLELGQPRLELRHRLCDLPDGRLAS